MAYGYSPRKISGGREASMSDGKNRSQVFLLIIMALCSFLFVFGLVSDVLESENTQDLQPVLMLIEDEPEKKQELLVNPDDAWGEKDDLKEKDYRILWKKPNEEKHLPTLWEIERKKEERKENAGHENWDVGSDM